jgi:hypothetical protein
MSQPTINNYDTTKLFLGRNKYKTATYTNNTGDTVTLSAGRLMGRIISSAKVAPQTGTATDGSEIPRFVLADTYTVANGASQTVTLCYAGMVASGELIFNGSDSLTTPLDEYMTSPTTDYDRIGILEDLLIANSHIELIAGTELTANDNQ